MKQVKRVWPLIVGILIIIFLGNLPVDPPNRTLIGLITLLITPLAVVAVQGRGRWFFSIAGLVIGSASGFLLGWLLGPMISDILFGPIPIESNIRIDLVVWVALSTSLFSAIGAYLGGFIRRHTSSDN